MDECGLHPAASCLSRISTAAAFLGPMPLNLHATWGCSSMLISCVLKSEVRQSWVALQRTHNKSQLWLEVRVDANTAAVRPVVLQESLEARAHMSCSSSEKWRRPRWQSLPFI